MEYSQNTTSLHEKIWFDPPSDCAFFSPVLPQGRPWGASFEMKRGERCQVTSGVQWCREPQLGLEALAVPEAGPLWGEWSVNGGQRDARCLTICLDEDGCWWLIDRLDLD